MVDKETKGVRKVGATSTLPELPYERIAMVGGEMPDELEWYDREVFLQLRMLYNQYRSGIVNREMATREKRNILRDYNFNISQSKYVKHFVAEGIASEIARQDYRKNRTLENADKLILALEGVPVIVKEEDKQ